MVRYKSFMKAFLCSLLAGSLVCGATACGGNRPGPGTGVGADNHAYGVQQLGRHDDIHRIGNPGFIHMRKGMRMHMNQHIRLSKRISDEIAKLPEVQSANVFLTERNAYVAVVLNSGDSFDQYTNNLYSNRFLNKVYPGGTVDRIGINSNDDFHLTAQIKKKITKKIHALTPVSHVFISANPDFVQRMSNVANDIRQGKPASGIINQFNAMMMRVFPSETRTNKTPAEGTQ